MPRGSGSKRKSQRVKKQSKKIKTLDSSARARAVHKRLNRLEEDNYKEEVDLNDAAYVDGEEEDMIQTSGSRKKKKKKAKRVKLTAAKSLDQLTKEAQLESFPSHIPTLLSISSSVPTYPAPNICSVSGFASKYRCRTCGMTYSSIQTYITHKETRCLCWKVY
eukprot:CAMPEP_0184482324 /NCGR_PEP_ID=MMETSP0113_2-20130426/3890_1 /TAXON_ID=91329 /ORGANISM="Norrisiella sphaerica, Strain BC52" /LENGTH=162 /DNA_ID=CAMNT_0026861983 /DNA_START=50 /DNA_END=538 /DNA_ORIENTATION=-